MTTYWRVPFPGGWSDAGDIDTKALNTGSEWDGRTHDIGGAYSLSLSYDPISGYGWGSARGGQIIMPRSAAFGGGTIGSGWQGGTPGIGYEWVENINTGNGQPTYVDDDFSRYRLALMGESRASNDNSFVLESQKQLPDLRGLSAYDPRLVPKTMRIKGLRLALHVRGGPWEASGPVAVMSTPIPTAPVLVYNVYGRMASPVGIENCKAMIYVIAADFATPGGVDTLTNVTVLKRLVYDASTGHIVASVPTDSIGSGPPGSMDPEAIPFYWGYSSWLALASDAPTFALQPDSYNMLGHDNYWWTGATLDRPGTSFIGPSPPAAFEGPGPETGPPGYTDDELYFGPYEMYEGGGSTNPIAYTTQPFDIDLSIDYSKVAGRSILIAYPACVPWMNNTSDLMWVGMDSTSNSDAAYPSGLSAHAGQVEITLPKPGAKCIAATLDISGAIPSAQLQADYWIPACVKATVGPGALGNTYYGPGIPWKPGDLYMGHPGLGLPISITLPGDGPLLHTDDPYTVDKAAAWFEVTGPNILGTWRSWQATMAHDGSAAKPWLGHAFCYCPSFGSSDAILLQGELYNYRLLVRYRALDDDVVEWDMSRFHGQLSGAYDYPWHWELIQGPWAEFRVPVAPRSTVFAGAQATGVSKAHRNLGHSDKPVRTS